MNKFMKKIMSKKDGFTLVELIVVIAILAILAGVAVPVYSGYIDKANKTADAATLEAIETAVVAATATKGAVTAIEVVAANGVISAVNVTGGGYATETDIMADITTVGTDFDNFAGTLPTLAYYTSGADWSSTGDNANEWIKK